MQKQKRTEKFRTLWDVIQQTADFVPKSKPP